jgi:hypothetical protein
MARQRPRDPYVALLRLAERELELAGAGEFGALAEIAAERDALIATLPDVPPADARETLERTALIQERTTIELQRGREQMLLAVRHVTHGLRAARGYGAALHPAPAAVHVDGHA